MTRNGGKDAGMRTREMDPTTQRQVAKAIDGLAVKLDGIVGEMTRRDAEQAAKLNKIEGAIARLTKSVVTLMGQAGAASGEYGDRGHAVSVDLMKAIIAGGMQNRLPA